MLLKSKEMAYLGMLLALNQLLIVLSSVIKTNTLLLLGFAAVIIGVVVVEFGIKRGIIFYIASCILGFFLTFNKVEIITYILLLGLYSLVKYAIEQYTTKKDISIVKEYIIKIIYFNIITIFAYFLLKQFVIIKLYWWLIIGGEIGFIIYDYAFTIFINAYINTIKPKLKK